MSTDTDPPTTPKPVDLSSFRAAVQLRDRCRAAAMAAHERAGLVPSVGHANSTYDAIAHLIREDERSRAASGAPTPDAYAAVCRALDARRQRVRDAVAELMRRGHIAADDLDLIREAIDGQLPATEETYRGA